MPYEEDQIAALDAGELQAKIDDEARKVRYVAEDAQTAARRAQDDALAAGGVVARKARRAELQLAIETRDSGQAVTQEQLAALQALIEKMQIPVAPVVEPIVVHQPDPVVPVV